MRKGNLKRMAFVLTGIIVVFIAPLVVFAAIYSSKEKENQFAPAQANLQIAENNNNAQETQTVNNLKWPDEGNHEVGKKVELQETANPNGEYLRVRFVPTWYKEGVVFAEIDSLTNFSSIRLDSERKSLLFCKGNGSDDVIVTLHLNDNWENDWTFDESNSEFKSKVLIKSSNGKRELLKKVEIPNSVYSVAKGADLELHVDVLADAIQTVDGQDSAPRWNDTP